MPHFSNPGSVADSDQVYGGQSYKGTRKKSPLVWTFQIFYDNLWASHQACSQVSIFGGAQYIFRGARFLLLLYVWNKCFWAQQNFGGHKKNWGDTAPKCPRGYGPASHKNGYFCWLNMRSFGKSSQLNTFHHFLTNRFKPGSKTCTTL